MEEHKSMIEKIQKLLKLAASDNIHEAELAAQKAQELLVKYNLDMQQVTGVDFEYKEEDFMSGLSKITYQHSVVQHILRNYFFVECLTQRKLVCRYPRKKWIGTIKIYGKSTNVEIARYVYTFLYRTFADLWRQYKKQVVSSGLKCSERNRRAYTLGIMRGLSDKLETARKKAEAERGLVLVKDPKIVNYSSGAKDSRIRLGGDASDYQAGIRDGKTIQIQGAIRTGAAPNSEKALSSSRQ